MGTVRAAAETRQAAPAPQAGPAYDTFLSFASVDKRKARWVHRFLESWADRGTRRRLRVFLDETDLRGGRLDEALRTAAHGARTLVVCWSPAAAESRWVQSEIALFRQKAEPDRIAVAVVGGRASAEEIGRDVLPGCELRVHDLRRGRWLAEVGLGARVELLRLLAFVADVELRTLRNWYLRRTLRNAALFVALALVPVQLLLNLPMDDWERLDLRRGEEPLYSVAAEADGRRLMVATRFRGAGPQGFRDYIAVVPDALGPEPQETFEEVALARRALPLSRLPYGAIALPPPDPEALAGLTTREAAGEPWLCAPGPGRIVSVQPLAATEEEVSEATDMAMDFGTPIPRVVGSLVVTHRDGLQLAAVVPDLSPEWQDSEPNLGRTPPSRGLAVAWSPEGEVWIGMQGRDARERGGLWRRPHGSRRWQRVPGFASVQSIDLEVRDGRTAAVWVAERHLDLWRGIVLVPIPTRVVALAAGSTEWRPAPAPAYGTRSEVELAGWLDAARVVRVDENVFRQRSLALWRVLLDRTGGR